MALPRKRSRLRWDVSIGLMLLVCGLALALLDRPDPAPQGGSAAVRTVLPYP